MKTANLGNEGVNRPNGDVTDEKLKWGLKEEVQKFWFRRHKDDDTVD